MVNINFDYTFMSLMKKLRSLRMIGSLGRQLSLYKVPDVQASIKIILEQAIGLAGRAQSRRKGSPRGLAAHYAVKLLKMRRYHYPIQYLIGEWPFRQLHLKLKSPILIPRFQTEHFIGEAIDAIKRKWKRESVIKFIDLGCGTGAIGLSFLKQLENDYSVQGILLDMNPMCLKLSKQNAVKNKIDMESITFVCDDMRNCSKLIEGCNIVVSNPPYLSSKQHKKLQRQVKMFEAHEALVGGEDGLEYVRFLVGQAKRQKAVRQDFMCFIEYGGQDVSSLGVEEHVELDQYGRRRFLMFT